MSDNNQATGGADLKASGDGVDGKPNEGNTDDSSGGDQTYPAHFVEKLKKEKDNYSRKVHDLTSKLEELESKIEQSQVSGLEEKEQFRTLWEQEKEKSVNAQKELSTMKTQMTEAQKRAEVKRSLLKLGLNPEHESTAFRLMDTSSVFVDKETGAIVGAEEAAKSFHEEYKSLGLFGRATPGVSHQAPETQTKTKGLKDMTPEELRQRHLELSRQGAN